MPVSLSIRVLPIFAAMSVPIEVLGPMLAVDTIPDTFGTVANVTADVGATGIIAHGIGELEEVVPATPADSKAVDEQPAPLTST